MKDQTLTRARLRTNPLRWISSKLVLNRLSLACVIAIFICGAASAQINFVQITDPHLYDDGQESNENKRALISCIAKIDQLIDAGADYKFAVVTGDIGIEKLVKPLLDQQKQLVEQKEKTVDQKQKTAIQEEIDRIERTIPLRITSAALEVANIVGQSKLKVWLFVPGNNDLIDEKTDTMKYYRDFIKQLHGNLSGKEVVDLCPTDNDPKSGVYSAVDGFAFIGFNNASFKNNNDARRISIDGNNAAAIVARTDPQKCDSLSTAEKAQSGTIPGTTAELPMTLTTGEQLKYVQQVIDRINSYPARRAYLFYHIPEIDDPYAVLKPDYDFLASRILTPSDHYALSSWFVDGCVRARWAKVITNNEVKGLFAGHFHDWRRETYKSFRWLATPDYVSGTLTKLYVCPPLAIKRQISEPMTARGFQTVSIDGTGKVALNVFWYDAASGTFQGLDETQVGWLSGTWRLLSSFVGYVWGSIPSYLPFYLLVVVCGYAAINGWKRITVVSPFHLPSNTQLPFGEHTVANALRDALVEIHKRGKDGGKEDTYGTSGLMTPKLEGIKFSEAASFEVPSRFAVEVKGLSHDAIISFARKVFRKEWVISGDIIGDTNTFRLLARHGTDLWCSSSNPATMEGLRRACGEVALRMLGTIDTTLLSAYTTLTASELIKQKKLEEALELMKEAASLLPNNALIAYDLGVAHARRGDNEKAIAALSRALELDNNFPEALNNLGVALAEEKDYDKAIASYERALSMRPEYPAVLYNLGDALYEKGRYSDAIDKYEKALKLQPNDSDILFNLGVALFYNGQYAEAIKRYEEVLQITPGDPEVLHHLGMSLFKYGKKSEAIDVVRQAQSARPQDKDIQKTLSEMLKAVGEELE